MLVSKFTICSMLFFFLACQKQGQDAPKDSNNSQRYDQREQRNRQYGDQGNYNQQNSNYYQPGSANYNSNFQGQPNSQYQYPNNSSPWTNDGGIYSQRNDMNGVTQPSYPGGNQILNQPYNGRIDVTPMPGNSAPGTQNVNIAVPVNTYEVAAAPGDWTWKMQLDYTDDSNDRTEDGNLEIINGKATIAIKSVPVGEVKLSMEILYQNKVIYKGEGAATVVSGQSSNATISMTKVGDTGDLNVKPEFDNSGDKDEPEGAPNPDENNPQLPGELSDWSGLTHKPAKGFKLDSQSL